MNFTSATQSVQYSYAQNSQELQSYTVNSRLRVDMTYDGNGNSLRETFRRLGRQTKAVSYQWDSRERLRQISYEDSSRPAFLPALPANRLEFKYDDFGNRIKKSASSGDATYYINAGLSVLNELDARGEVSKTIVQGLSQIAEIDADGRITFIHSDVLGSAIFVSDEAGNVVQQYDYDPFGGLIGSLGAADGAGQTRYQFTGQEFDSESDLGYFNARYYNPTLGRFLSRDSLLGSDGDLLARNRYNYVKNNPLKYVDPTGNEAVGAQAEEYGSDEVVYASVQQQPQVLVAGWGSDAWSFTKSATISAWNVTKSGAQWTWDKTKAGAEAVADAGEVVVDFSSDVIKGTAYSITDNYTYGYGTKNVSPPDSFGGQIGQSLGDAITYVGGTAETVGGVIIGTGGTAGTVIGGATCPVTVGAGCVAAGVSAGAAAAGTAISAHGGSVLLYTMGKDGSGGGGLGSSNPSLPGQQDNNRFIKLKGDQGWKDEAGNIWKKDKLHKDHWDISNKKGNKIKEVDFNGNELWPGGPKNKNKKP